MNKNISVILIFLLSVFLAGCCGCSQSSPTYYDEDVVEDVSQELTVDTINEIKQVNEEANDASVSSLKPNRSSSSYRYEENESDNMRGFDPASEDDMDDNGMSRYMENNDEEGWN